MRNVILFFITGIIIIYPLIFLMIQFSTPVIENGLIIGETHRSLLNLYFEIQNDYGVPAILLLTVPHMTFMIILLIKEQRVTRQSFTNVEVKEQ